MDAFRISTELREMGFMYPSAEAVSSLAKRGDNSTRDAIARQLLSEGVPYAFRNCPDIYESVRVWIAKQLQIDPKEVSLTGSARLGQSLSPHKLGRPFGDNSDLDIFVVSNDLFCRLTKDFTSWSIDVEMGSLTPSNDREGFFWKENIERCPRNISRGFVDSKLIPNRIEYKNVQKIAQTMFLLKKKISLTEGAPKISHASVRCYNSWQSYVNQVSLSLK